MRSVGRDRDSTRLADNLLFRRSGLCYDLLPAASQNGRTEETEQPFRTRRPAVGQTKKWVIIVRRLSRGTTVAAAVAAGTFTLLGGAGVAMAANSTPSSPASSTVSAGAAPTAGSTGITAPGQTADTPTAGDIADPAADVPTAGDVKDVSATDAETADGAKDTDNVQQGDQSGPDTGKEVADPAQG